MTIMNLDIHDDDDDNNNDDDVNGDKTLFVSA